MSTEEHSYTIILSRRIDLYAVS